MLRERTFANTETTAMTNKRPALIRKAPKQGFTFFMADDLLLPSVDEAFQRELHRTHQFGEGMMRLAIRSYSDLVGVIAGVEPLL
jgi:predicted ABC-type ATPase